MNSCPSCSENLMPGAMFCDSCGASTSQGNVVRKLRQASFDTVTASKGGLLAPGQVIKGRHKYLIEEAIARSGFGATFRALRLRDEKQVLIKQMLEQSTYDKFRSELMKSFKRESAFLRKVRHPAFPRGYEYFIRNKSFYMVMEFINGKELAKAVRDYRQKKGKIEDGLVIYLGIQIADALEVIHSYGYLYRDLKPQNVMLDGVLSRVKLIDFGTLYHLSDSDPLIFESEGYTPPEFLSKDNTFTAAGDIYSLGALLYEVATGEMPELGKTKGIRDGKRDKRLCAVIEKCLNKDPLERYQRARHLKDEFVKLTRRGLWPFRNRDAISPIEISVLPNTLYPSSCTFCEYCGYADPRSQVGYCKQCRVPFKVGRLQLMDKNEVQKEFFLYSDETVVGSSKQCHFCIDSKGKKADLSSRHLRIFRRGASLWIESLVKDIENISLNGRRVLGPVELIEGDLIKVANLMLKYSLKSAC